MNDRYVDDMPKRLSSHGVPCTNKYPMKEFGREYIDPYVHSYEGILRDALRFFPDY